MGSRTNTQPSGGKAAEEEKQMSTYMFGGYRPGKELSARLQNQVSKICIRHGGDGLDGGNIPGDGWSYWFVGPNRGEPFDRDLKAAVLAEIDAKGIEWGTPQ